MNVYLVQHAEAVPKEHDPERPLSSKGLAEIKKVAEFIAKNCEIAADQILHSGKLRARQTAEILASNLNLSAPVETDGLSPLDDPSVWAARLAQKDDNLVLVGHLPHMGKLASTLLCSAPEAQPVAFQMGGMVALTLQEQDNWSLHWMVIPAILP